MIMSNQLRSCFFQAEREHASYDYRHICRLGETKIAVHSNADYLLEYLFPEDHKYFVDKTVSTFVTKGVQDDSREPAFKFLLKNGCVKGREIGRTWSLW